MGGTVSRPGGVENPFPVNPSLSKDLDMLTTVVVRLLSSSDIYDIANLENPGVCGAYAVFLRKNIEKRLLSFSVDMSGGETIDILYQNPSKMIPAAKRREICKKLAESMVTLVATIVALLASIQVKSDSRSAAARAAAAVVGQRGGADISTIIEWLRTNGYIRTTPTIPPIGESIRLELYSAELEGQRNAPKFYLTLNRTITSRRTYTGTITATGGRGYDGVQDAFPTGALEVQLMQPIELPGSPTRESILPFRLSDRSNLPWMAGALYKTVFFTAAPTDPETAISPFDVWSDIFRRTQGHTTVYGGRESRTDINRAAEVFAQYTRTQDARVFLQAMAPLLTHWTEYRPEAAGLAATTAVYPPPYPGYPPAAAYPYGAAPYPAARPLPPPLPVARRPVVGTGAGVGATPLLAPAAAVAGATYDIARPSTEVILRTLRNYRQLVPEESSPAAVRAFTLAGKVNTDRTINTDVCNDPYWRLAGLHLIYPWATLQFLCVNSWEKLGTSGGRDVFHPVWPEFLQELRGMYSGADTSKPKIAGPADNQVLNGLTFTDVDRVPVCVNTRAPRVRFHAVQDGLLTLQGRYERHVRRVWDLLNSLIVVIVDPETREQTVRLHPKVYGTGSNTYVETQATAARGLLKDFYLGVEQDYLKTVAALVAT
jgi:hypothetical protein